MRLPRFILLALAALWLTGSAFAQTRYRNLVNDRFATVSNGPQSVVVVDVNKSATKAQIDAAIEARLKQLWKTSGRSVKHTARGRAQSVKRANYPMSTVIAVRQDGKLIVKAPTRQVGGGTLNFVFSNFQGKQILAGSTPVVIEDFLRTLLLGDGQREGLYNKIVRLYGQPSWSGTVEIRSMGFYDDGEATDPQRVLFGSYDVSNARIMMPLYESIDSTAHAFLLGILHAFHGPAVLQYDAWEQGFIRAAATVIARDTQLGFLDPSNNFFYTNLHRYDLLNQPALAGPRFVPASQQNVAYEGQFGVYKMLWARMSMSGSAWLKCYIENPNFFKDFNAAYYAQFTPGVTPSLAGNVPQLKAIAASVLPTVEGMPFEEWFSRQYVFDTAVTPGAKLYAFPYALKRETTSDGTRNDLSFTVVYYRSTYEAASGRDDEILLGGRAYAIYTDALGQRFPTGGAQGDSAQVEAGEGFLTASFVTGEGNEIGRLTVDFAIGSETARVYLPVGNTGDVRGVGLGSTQGAIRVEQATILPGGTNRVQSTTFTDKAFGVQFGGGGGELFQTQFVVDDGGVVRTFRKNLGDIAPGETTVGEDASAMVVLPAPGTGGGIQTVSRDFTPNPNAAPYLVSFPVRPLASSVEQAFGLPASDFLVTGFDTGSGAYATLTAGQPSAPALAPGRGFWFKYAPGSGSGNVRVTLTGVAPPTDTDFPIAARYGWNLVGSPFESDVPLSTIRVKLQDRDPLTWEEAVAANLVLAEAFDFDANAGYRSATALQGGQWRGYWVRVLAPSGVTLLIPGPDVSRKVAVGSRATAVNSASIWAVKLTAQQQVPNLPFGGVASASLGAKEGATRSVDARDSQSPPDIIEALSVSFGENALPGGGRLTGDFRDRKSAAQGTWTVQLKSPQGGATRLRWEGLGSVPRNVRLTLKDGDKRISLSQSSGYSLTLEAGKTRTLTITAEAGRLNPLRITALTTTTRSAGQGGIGVRYTVTDDADIIAEITTMGGRSVAHLSGGRSRANEQANLRWNGRSEAGAALPAGAYLLTLTARGENGETARLTRPVMVIR